jgi:copper chaperone CopZ
MKKLSFLLIGVLLLVLSCVSTEEKEGSDAAQQTKEQVSEENMAFVVYNVEGMTCTGCEKTITSKLDKMDGIVEVQASFEDQKAKVKFDSTKLMTDGIMMAIEEAGYKVNGYEYVK